MWASICPAALTAIQSNVPTAINDALGYHILSTAGTSLAYDTRNSVQLPNKGQRTELIAQLTGGPLGGSYSYYRLEAHTAHYFRGLSPGHVLELGGVAGVVDEFGRASDVPFFERYYLGRAQLLAGLQVSLRQPAAVAEYPR